MNPFSGVWISDSQVSKEMRNIPISHYRYHINLCSYLVHIKNICRLPQKPWHYIKAGTKPVIDILRNDRFEVVSVTLLCNSFVSIDIQYLFIFFHRLCPSYRLQNESCNQYQVFYCRGKYGNNINVNVIHFFYQILY